MHLGKAGGPGKTRPEHRAAPPGPRRGAFWCSSRAPAVAKLIYIHFLTRD
jgi:hypothetical protein